MNDRVRLILLSFLMLFVELALIRWAGSNVVYLAYFSNFVLLGSFLGIGIGFLRANSRVNLFPYAPIALAALVAFIRLVPVEVRRTGEDLIFFGGSQTSGPPREVALTAVFVAVAAVMAFLAEGVARTFKRFEALEAYRLDIIGSVLGVVGFSVLSFLHAPPLVWGVIAGMLLFVLNPPPLDARRLLAVLQIASVGAIVLLLAFETFAAGTSWSPYYKVTTERHETLDRTRVRVNGVTHQAYLEAVGNPIYEKVYEVVEPRQFDEVLVIGAGSGNDVSVALERGAEHVDAVEIDPRIYDLGKANHPDRPYDDPRVDIHIDDGRAFLERSDKEWDLIVFALPDSLTLIQGQSSLRLESYLFTKEAMESARGHLADGGVFAMYNFYREPWLVDRYANTLDEAFGRPPCLDSIQSEDGSAMGILANSDDAGSLQCTQPWQQTVSDAEAAPATDDHPFPYLRTRSLPVFYLVTIALILAFSLVLIRGFAGPLRPMAGYLDLFFMGAAFLLLETKNVVQFALLFGTTWFVNALVFTGVLLSVLAAVEVSRRVNIARPGRLYVALIATVALAWLVPPSALLELAVVPRFVLAVTIAFAPIFLANMVFAQRFKDVGSSTTAFGANLLGAMVGGLLEYGALVTGYRAMLFVVAALYGLAFLFGREHLREGAAPPRATEPAPAVVR